MAYKDKDKQREADRARQQRRRDKRRDELQGVTQGVTGSMDIKTLAQIDAACGESLTHGLPTNYGQPNCECMHCQSKRVNKSSNIINHGQYKPAHLLGKNEVNRVSLPGDPDYDGVCLDAKYDDRRIDLPGCMLDDKNREKKVMRTWFEPTGNPEIHDYDPYAPPTPPLLICRSPSTPNPPLALGIPDKEERQASVIEQVLFIPEAMCVSDEKPATAWYHFLFLW